MTRGDEAGADTSATPTTEHNASPQKALALAAFFTVVAIAQLNELQSVFSSSLGDAFAAFRDSPWALAALIDYIVGAIFASLYLALRPALLPAVLTPFLGSFVVLLYMAAVLVHRRDAVHAMLPKGGRDAYISSKRARYAFWGFAGLLMLLSGVCMYAWITERLQDGYRVIKTVPWVQMTFVDNLGGLVFTVAFVVIREGGLSWKVGLWLTGFLFLGNITTCIYVMLVAREAIRYDVAFEELLLSNRNAFFDDVSF